MNRISPVVCEDGSVIIFYEEMRASSEFTTRQRDTGVNL